MRTDSLDLHWNKLENFWLYETKTAYYLVGYHGLQPRYRLMKIKRAVDREQTLTDLIFVDPGVYSEQELAQTLDMVAEGNRAVGGLKRICFAYGIVGFVKFLGSYYLILITSRKEVGCIGGRFVYSIRATETFPIAQTGVSSARSALPQSAEINDYDFGDQLRPPRHSETSKGVHAGSMPKGTKKKFSLGTFVRRIGTNLTQSAAEVAENKYQGIFNFMDLTKDFFFSYDYDLTHSLQHNYVHAQRMTEHGTNFFRHTATATATPTATSSPTLTSATSASTYDDDPMTLATPEETFMWNHFLSEELTAAIGPGAANLWVLPLIHGSLQQKRFAIFGNTLDMLLIARRSRHFAGTRYLKRGVSVHGKVANDCEVEQILQYERGAELHFASYVQMRGSIPTYWCQETSVTMPKPPIIINRVDSDYAATREHFSDLFRRYSTPIIVLDLIKQHEKKPRESLVGAEFKDAIDTLNDNIPMNLKVRYIALDYSRINGISKGKLLKAKNMRGANLAMAVVGDQWALMESSLTSKQERRTILQKTKNGEKESEKSKPVAPALTDFEEAKKHLSRRPDTGADTASTPSSASIPTNTSNSPQEISPGVNLQEIHALESRLDVLKELEDIANMTLSETGFFCSSLLHLSSMKILSKEHREKALSRSFLSQQGVLRTNCIDCLDRTNGGQFAVAMRFLYKALLALGVADKETISMMMENGRHPIVHSLMEMYGDMGNHIALQYGGSAAHNKVLAGRAASSSHSTSKHSELLTSMKRYYSNAFTDRLKQDAMNLFLGQFIPYQHTVHLWDLENDYHLHNHLLRPPLPGVNQVLYHDVTALFRTLSGPSVRNVLIKALRKEFIRYLVKAGVAVPNELLSEEVETKNESLNIIENSLYINMDVLLKRYFIKLLAQSPDAAAHLNENFTLHTPKQIKKQATDLPSLTPPTPPLRPVSVATREINLAVETMARMEEHKVFRAIVSKQIQDQSQRWWRDALEAYDMTLYGRCQSQLSRQTHASIRLAPSKFRKLRSTRIRQKKRMRAEQEHVLLSRPFFDCYYRPDRLSEFDTLLRMEFFRPIQATHGPDSLVDEEGNVIVEDDSDSELQPGMISRCSTNSARHSLGNTDNRSTMFRTRSFRLAHDETHSRKSFAGYDEATQGPIRSYMRDLGQKARTLVGGLLRREDEHECHNENHNTDGNMPSSQYSRKRRYIGDRTPITDLHNSIPRGSMTMYITYCFSPEKFFNYHFGDLNNNAEEYRDLVKEVLLSSECVSRLTSFQSESYVTRVVGHGVYAGLPQTTSAKLVTGSLQSFVTFAKMDLNHFAGTIDQRADQARRHVLPMHDAQTTENLAKSASIMTLKQASQQMTKSIHSKAVKHLAAYPDAHGLVVDLQLSMNTDLFQRYTYNKETAAERLQRPLSSLTSESTILSYASQFDVAITASDWKSVQRITSTSPHFSSFSQFSELTQYLEPLTIAADKAKSEQYQAYLNDFADSSENYKDWVCATDEDLRENEFEYYTSTALRRSRISAESAVDLEPLLSEVLDVNISSKVEEDVREFYDQFYGASLSDPHTPAVTHGVYEGFLTRGDDLYAKASNPHLLLNEISVRQFQRVMET